MKKTGLFLAMLFLVPGAHAEGVVNADTCTPQPECRIVYTDNLIPGSPGGGIVNRGLSAPLPRPDPTRPGATSVSPSKPWYQDLPNALRDTYRLPNVELNR